MRSFTQDLRYAARLLTHSPGFACLVVLVLALGIGANSAIFSVVDTALLRPLPFHEPGRIVSLWEDPPSHANRIRASPLNFLDWHDQNSAFTHMAAYAGGSKTLQPPGGGPAERLVGQAVTLEFFDLLGIRPIAGRLFNGDDQRDRTDVVLLSEKAWRSRFGADPKLVGGTITLDGKPFLVAGIIPAKFQFIWKTDVWSLFIVKRDPDQRRMHYLGVIGRLKPGLSIVQAREAMAPVARHLATIAPATNKDWGIRIEPLHETLVGTELRDTSLVLAGVVSLVLLMACANVASLILTRSSRRAREMAVRASLGAGRWRLIRQLLTESLLLAMLGGACGLALAWTLIRIAPSLIPPGTIPPGLTLELDLRVACYALGATVVTGILFGLVPAWQSARVSLADAMRGGGGSRNSTSGNTRILGSIAVAQIAVGVVMVTAAGLFLRTLDRLTQVDPGFHASNVLTMHISLPPTRYVNPENLVAFYDAAQREIESIPGVRSASFGGSLPLAGWEIGQGFQVVGEPEIEAAKRRAAHYQIVGHRYFETLGIPLLAGRPFDDRDAAHGQPVAIVNQEFVRRYLHGAPAIGRHVKVQSMNMNGPQTVDREIVGVCGQVRRSSVVGRRCQERNSEGRSESCVDRRQNDGANHARIRGTPPIPRTIARRFRRAGAIALRRRRLRCARVFRGAANSRVWNSHGARRPGSNRSANGAVPRNENRLGRHRTRNRGQRRLGTQPHEPAVRREAVGRPLVPSRLVDSRAGGTGGGLDSSDSCIACRSDDRLARRIKN